MRGPDPSAGRGAAASAAPDHEKIRTREAIEYGQEKRSAVFGGAGPGRRDAGGASTRALEGLSDDSAAQDHEKIQLLLVSVSFHGPARRRARWRASARILRRGRFLAAVNVRCNGSCSGPYMNRCEAAAVREAATASLTCFGLINRLPPH